MNLCASVYQYFFVAIATFTVKSEVQLSFISRHQMKLFETYERTKLCKLKLGGKDLQG